MSEVEEIVRRYDRRKIAQDQNLYSYFNLGNLYITQQLERKILNILDRYGFNPLYDKKILDVGCGGGGWLRNFIKWGAKPKNLFGVDLLEDNIKIAKETFPNINFAVGNAESLALPDKTFDIVIQSTVFTSIFNFEMKRNIAEQMMRLVKNDGIILWHDFFYDNPNNPDVKGIKKREIKQLFPYCTYDFNKVTLAPPIVRVLAPRSWLLCYILEKIPLLRTHYIVIIKKAKEG